jgi:ribosome-binding factor A
MTSHRRDRVADQLQRMVARLVQTEMRDPRLGFVTVTAVRVSPDLRHARVFVTFMNAEDPAAALEALNHAAPFLRRQLAREAGLRFTPELRFLRDDAEERGWRVDGILRQIDAQGTAAEPDAAPVDDDPAADHEPGTHER